MLELDVILCNRNSTSKVCVYEKEMQYIIQVVIKQASHEAYANCRMKMVARVSLSSGKVSQWSLF